MPLNFLPSIVFTNNEYLSSAVNVLTKSLKNLMSLRVTFPTQLPLQSSINMIKALSLRLYPCFRPFPISCVERAAQAGPFRHLSKDLFPGW